VCETTQSVCRPELLTGDCVLPFTLAGISRSFAAARLSKSSLVAASPLAGAIAAKQQLNMASRMSSLALRVALLAGQEEGVCFARKAVYCRQMAWCKF
jgi:hypothetical protein